MTTTNYKKRKKSKLTSGKIAKYQEQMREHNKFMKRIGAPEQVMNLQEYIAYAQGNYKPKTQPRAVNLPGMKQVMHLKELPMYLVHQVKKVLLLQQRNQI